MKIMSWALTLAATAVVAEPKIVQYLRTSLYVYDDKGALVGSRPANLFPKELHIDKYDESTGRLAVQFEGKTIFLRNAEVVTKGLAAHCRQALVSAKTATQHLAASDVGAKAGLGSDSVGCIQGPKSP